MDGSVERDAFLPAAFSLHGCLLHTAALRENVFSTSLIDAEADACFLCSFRCEMSSTKIDRFFIISRALLADWLTDCVEDAIIGEALTRIARHEMFLA